MSRLPVEAVVKDTVENFNRNNETFDILKVFKSIREKFDGVTLNEHFGPVKEALVKLGLSTKVARRPAKAVVTADYSQIEPRVLAAIEQLQVEQTVVKVGTKNRILIPKKFLEKIHAYPGDTVHLSYTNQVPSRYHISRTNPGYNELGSFTVEEHGHVRIKSTLISNHKRFLVEHHGFGSLEIKPYPSKRR